MSFFLPLCFILNICFNNFICILQSKNSFCHFSNFIVVINSILNYNVFNKSERSFHFYGIEKTISGLSEKYIFNETVGSLLLLLLSHIERRNKETAFTSVYELDNDLKELQNKITHYTIDMETILLDQEEKKKGFK